MKDQDPKLRAGNYAEALVPIATNAVLEVIEAKDVAEKDPEVLRHVERLSKAMLRELAEGSDGVDVLEQRAVLAEVLRLNHNRQIRRTTRDAVLAVARAIIPILVASL